MTYVILTLWLQNGAVISGPATMADCTELIGIARYADATGGELRRKDATGDHVVLRLQCSEFKIGPSSGDCETEGPTS